MKNNMAAKPAVKPQDSSPKAKESSLKDDFDSLTSGIQRILDIGAEALAEAEKKTEQVAKMDVASTEYAKMVAEVKAAQARAGNAFKQAEELIASANELLPKKK